MLYQVPKYLALAVARQESGMHPWIINIAGKAVRPANGEEALSLKSRKYISMQEG
jgi:hypothetical protein